MRYSPGMAEAVQNCIWCTKPVRKANVEHIMPDALGCPSHFVLRDTVCIGCNNGLGHVDQALLRQFEIIAFMMGVPRKDGRPPLINQWGPIRGRYTPTGPEIHLNAGPGTVASFGKNLPAASARNGITGISMEPRVVGERSEVSFNVEFGNEPKFSRAVHKVALGSVAFFAGADEALSSRFDPVRAFVRKGIGQFDVLMMGGTIGRHHQFGPPVQLEGHALPLVEMEILGIAFAVDLDPAQQALQRVAESLRSRAVDGWMIIPHPRRTRSASPAV